MRRENSVRTGMFCRLGSVDDSRPVCAQRQRTTQTHSTVSTHIGLLDALHAEREDRADVDLLELPRAALAAVVLDLGR